MRKIWKIAVSLASCVALTFSACSSKKREAFADPEELFTRIENSKVERFDSVELKPIETEVEWSSSNESVAVIEDGRLVAISEGETVVTAKKGEQTQRQTVQVFDEGKRPTVDLDYLAVLYGTSYEISANAYFRNRKLEDVMFSYTVENTSIASVQGNMLTGHAYGETSVTITADWRGQENVVQATVPCTVNRNMAVYTDKEEYVLYTLGNVLGASFPTASDIVPTVYYENQVIEDVTIEWESSDESVVTVNGNGRVEAVSAGEAYVVGKCVYDGVELKTRNVPVKVERPYVFTDKDYLFDVNENEARFDQSALAEGYTVGKAVDLETGKEYSLANGRWDISGFSSGEYRFALYESNMTFGAEVNIIFADYIVSTVEDLKEISSHPKAYIALANDISNVGEYQANLGFEYQFTGTFNGLGHTISGIQFTSSGNGGLFSEVATCSFKNVSIVGELSGKNQGALFYRASGKCSVTVDNVYIHLTITADTAAASGVVGAYVHTGSSLTMTNCVVKADGLNRSEAVQANCGFITGRVKSMLIKLENCYLIGVGKVCSQFADETNKFYDMYNATYANDVYEDEQALSETEGLDFSGFNQHWQIINGVPTFGN